MLSADDARLVDRDEGLPDLSLLLDADAFAEALREACPDAGVTTVEANYVRYKPGRSCVVGYVVQGAAGAFEAYARAHRADAREKLEKAVQADGVPSGLGAGVVVLPGRSVVVFGFPNDHELPGSGRLADTRSLLERLLPDETDLWEGRLETLRYKPERRYVARLDVDGTPRAVLRFYTEEDFRRTSEAMKRLDSRPPLRIARRLRRSQRLSIAAVEWLEGQPLHAALMEGEGVDDACRTTGAALAEMHGQTLKKKRCVDVANPPHSAADVVGQLAPELADRARRLAVQIETLGEAVEPLEPCVVHGDFSADQVVLNDGEAGIIDLDRATYGDPRADLASFRATLLRDVATEGLAAVNAYAAFASLLDGYGLRPGETVVSGLDQMTSAVLLRLAVEPFRYREPDWLDRTDRILACAEAFADAYAGARR